MCHILMQPARKESNAGLALGSLCESFGHECTKTYVCVLYCSSCVPLLAPWLGELEGTSLAIAQAKVQPVLALEPMFGVLTVLCRRCAADGRRSLTKTSFRTLTSVPHTGLCGGRTQWEVRPK